jgi:hypothetical protein
MLLMQLRQPFLILRLLDSLLDKMSHSLLFNQQENVVMKVKEEVAQNGKTDDVITTTEEIE